MLDDPQEVSVAVADDAPEPFVRLGRCRPHDASRVVVLQFLQESGQGSPLQQRSIAGQHQNRPVMIGQSIAAHHHGVPGSQLLGLQGELHIVMVLQGLFDHFGLVAHHHHDPFRSGLAGRIENVFHHRPAENLVQDLRSLGFHPLALAGRQNDCHGIVHGMTPV